MKRKIISIFLIVVSLLFCFPLTANAAAERTVTHTYLGILFKSGDPIRSEQDSLPITISSNDKLQSDISDIEVTFDISNCSANSTLTATYVFNGGGAYRIQSFENVQAYYRTSKETSEIIDISNYSYDASTGTFTFSIDVDEVGSDGFCSVTSWLGVASTINGNAKAWARLTGVSVTSESQEKGWQNKISAWFSNLFQWLKDIRDNLTNMGSNIGKWFSDLGNNIKGFFSDLTNSIKEQFNNMIDKLKGFFDNVGQWFKDIGDRIGGFFTTLWNKLWYGNENGAAEYQKPVINNKLDDIIATLTDYQTQLKGTIDTIGTAADSVSSYISTGTEIVNGIINVAGVGFTALIVFGMVFVLVRKVVGR